MPVISSENLFATGTTATVQGLGRDHTHGDVSSLGIVNLGQQAAQCQANVFRADGSRIAPTVSLALKPLSFVYFSDTLGILHELNAVDVRIQVSCNQSFYVYGTFFSGATSQLLFLTPASSGSSLTAPPPGQRRLHSTHSHGHRQRLRRSRALPHPHPRQ